MTQKTLITKADTIFSLFIRLRDTNSNGWGRCVSCRKLTFIKAANNCHYIPRGCKKYRLAEDNCKLGCVSCNKYRPGFHYAKYTLIMNAELGESEVKKRWAFWEAQTPYKIRTVDYEEMIDHYTMACQSLLSEKSPNVQKLFSIKTSKSKATKARVRTSLSGK